MRFAIYAFLITLNLSGSSKKKNDNETKKEHGHTRIESVADKRRRALAQKDELSEEDLTEQSAILYNYLLEQNKSQMKRLPEMMQNGAPVPGFNNEEFDKLEQESQERWEVILEYHPDVLASVIRRMKDMYYEIYTDPEIKKVNTAMVLQPWARLAHVFNHDDDDDDDEEPLDMEKMRKDVEEALDKYFDKIYQTEDFWEPLVKMSLKMANRVENPDFRNAIKQWSRGERKGLAYMIDESFDDFLDIMVWVSQASMKSVDVFIIKLIDPKEKFDEDTRESISNIFSSIANMFNKAAFRPILNVVAKMMKDPEQYKNNPDALVGDIVDGMPEMMAGVMQGMPGGGDPEIAAQMRQSLENPDFKEMMNQHMNHALKHPMDLMDPQFHPQAMSGKKE